MKYLTAGPFVLYYLQFRLTLMLGLHATAFPVDISWRWRHWQQIKRKGWWTAQKKF